MKILKATEECIGKCPRSKKSCFEGDVREYREEPYYQASWGLGLDTFLRSDMQRNVRRLAENVKGCLNANNRGPSFPALKMFPS